MCLQSSHNTVCLSPEYLLDILVSLLIILRISHGYSCIIIDNLAILLTKRGSGCDAIAVLLQIYTIAQYPMHISNVCVFFINFLITFAGENIS